MKRLGRTWRWQQIMAGAVLGVFLPGQAMAAGMFLAPRGVRPLARAGAFIAGVDDIHALNYNPAGLGVAANAAQLDLALPMYDTTYTRSVYGDDYYETPVTGHGLGLPSPTLGVVHSLGLVDGLAFGLSYTAEYPLLQEWPGGFEAPQRYATADYRGTTLSKVAIGAGYRIFDWLSVGASFQAMVGSFSSINTISGCDNSLLCTQPENPDFDIVARMTAKNLFIPGGQVGVQVRPVEWLGIGLAWESGYTIDKDVSLAIRLPSAAVFDGAFVTPDNATGHIHLKLPQQFRAGVEARINNDARVEAAFVYDPWSVQDTIAVKTNDTALSNIVGIGTASVAALPIERGLRDTWSVRLGGEYRPPLGATRPLTLRAGTLYEPSAVPANVLSPMMVDLRKIMASAGVEYRWGRWHFEATYAHLFMFDQKVTDGQITQINPIQPASAAVTPIGNGMYQASADLVGVGARFDI